MAAIEESAPDQFRSGDLAPDDSTSEPPARRAALATLAGRLVLGCAIAMIIVPLSPTMPELGLDASWKVAINRATAHGLQFGHDIVFTYGPYAGILTGVYEPGIRALTLAAALLLAAGYITAALLTLRRAPWWVYLAAAIVGLVLTSISLQGLDVLVLLYPLLVVAAVRHLPTRPMARMVILVLLTSPLGLLPITKLSVVPALVVGIFAVAILLLRRSDWPGLAVLVIAPTLNLGAWWIAAHQSIPGLIDYVRSSRDVVSGYSEAMGLDEISRLPAGMATATFVVTAVAVMACGLAGRRDLDRMVELAMVALTLFLAFKSSFVRADAPTHMEGGALPLLTAAVVIARQHPVRRLLWALAGPAAVLGAAACYLSAPFSNPVPHIDDRTVGALADVVQGKAGSSSLHRRYDAAMDSIREQATIPEAHGSTDLYTSTLNLLFAQGAHWDPRPVIQSYAAYTPELTAMNARHLRDRDAPRTVLIQIGPIDNRLAGLEDGASWLPLLENYDVRPDSSNYLALRRRESPRPVAVGDRSVVLHGRIGARLRLPAATSNWLATFDVRPTLAGKIRNALWRPPHLAIEVQTADGTTDVRRFIPTMARSEFILSPYITDTASLRSLFPGEIPTAPGREVTAIRIVADSGSALTFWDRQYELRLRSLAVTP